MFVAQTVTDWGDALRGSFETALGVLLSGIPKVIGFLVILIVGWIIASIIAKAVQLLLDAVKFNSMADRAGITGFVRDMGVNMTAADVVADVVKWFIRLIVLVAAFDALGLPAISAVLQQLLLWIPNLIVAMVILVIGGLLANALYHIVRGATAEAGLGNPDLLGTLAKYAVIVFAIMIAVYQIGIATALVTTLFTGFVFALALALGLAFGLGGRDTAAQIVQQWYMRGKMAAPQIQQAAGNAQERAAQQSSTSTPPGAVPSDRRTTR